MRRKIMCAMLLFSSVMACETALCISKADKKIRKTYLKNIKDAHNKPIKTVVRLSKASNIDKLLEQMYSDPKCKDHRRMLCDMFVEAYQKKLGSDWKKQNTTVRKKADEYFSKYKHANKAADHWSAAVSNVDSISKQDQFLDIDHSIKSDIDTLFSNLADGNVVASLKTIAEYKMVQKHLSRLAFKKGMGKVMNSVGLDANAIDKHAQKAVQKGNEALHKAAQGVHNATTSIVHGSMQAAGNAVKAGVGQIQSGMSHVNNVLSGKQS